jgi:cytochrome P450
MFSSELSGPAIAEIHRSLPVLGRGAAIRGLMPKVFDDLPLGLHRRFDTAAARLRAVLDEIRDRYRAEGVDDGDLLSMLLAARDADTGEAMSDVQIRDELMAMLVAGIETTATTLTWAFHHLGRHPDIAERVQNEVAAVVGSRSIRVDDLSKLVYTRQVITEANRMCSPVIVMRRTVAPVDIGGYLFPADSEVAFSPYALHRDPARFPDPERFDPDRWLPARADRLPRGAFIPFGDGTRKCIGDAFAWTELMIAVATITAHWQLVPVPGHTIREIFAAMPQPSSLLMTAHPRHPA